MTAYSTNVSTMNVPVTMNNVEQDHSYTTSIWHKICWWRGLRRGAQNVLPNLSNLDHE